MAMEIVTGHTGKAHVTSADDRALNIGTFGTGNYVLKTGSQFNYTLNSSTKITLSSGDLVMKGCHARIRPGENASVNLDSGTSGYKRIDLICARYTSTDGIEKVELVVIKGDAYPDTPTAPAYNNGDIYNGAEICDFPLYSVKINGVNIEGVTKLFGTIVPTEKVRESIFDRSGLISQNAGHYTHSFTNRDLNKYIPYIVWRVAGELNWLPGTNYYDSNEFYTTRTTVKVEFTGGNFVVDIANQNNQSHPTDTSTQIEIGVRWMPIS